MNRKEATESNIPSVKQPSVVDRQLEEEELNEVSAGKISPKQKAWLCSNFNLTLGPSSGS